MIVFSPLSLYTTYLGWQQYDILFDALWQTGLLYFGFLSLSFRFLKNILAPAGSTQHTADHALNHYLFELATIFLICAFFVYPCVPLEQKGLSFKPLCAAKLVKASTLKHTGTTYDEAFADVLSSQVKIPLGFSILQNYFSSLTYGLMKVTGCTDSLQAIQGDLVSTYIPAKLKKQALNFHQQCFLEARSIYSNNPPDSPEAENSLKRHGGEDDLNWMGSKTYQTLYYDKLMAREPVPGFLFTQYPSAHFKNAAKEDKTIETHLPHNGYPSCNQWWSKIRSDLVKATDRAGVFDKHLGVLDVTSRVYAYKKQHQLAWNSDISPEDFIAKVLLQDNRDLQVKSAQGLIDPTTSNLGNIITRGLINVGQNVKSWTSTPLKREAILQTLPVMHAFFYFFLIVFTPIILALSGYSPRALGSLCALFIMAIFLQYIWHLVGFIERSVLDPMGEQEVVAAMRNMAVLFYIIAPGILLKLSSHFGGDAGAGLAGLMHASDQTAQEHAQSSIQFVKASARGLSKL